MELLAPSLIVLAGVGGGIGLLAAMGRAAEQYANPLKIQRDLVRERARQIEADPQAYREYIQAQQNLLAVRRRALNSPHTTSRPAQPGRSLRAAHELTE